MSKKRNLNYEQRTEILKCDKCNKEFIIRRQIMLQRIRYNTPMYCKSCMSIYRSNTVKNIMNNLSPEEKNQRNQKRNDTINKKSIEEKERTKEKRKSYWNNLSKEEKDIRMNALNKGNRNWKNNITDEDRIKYGNKLSKSIKHYWVNHPEKKQERSQQKKDWWSNLSIEEYNSINNKKKETYNNLSQEEKDRRTMELTKNYLNWYHNECDKDKWKIHCSKISKLYWDNITDEEKQQRIQNHIKWHNNLSIEQKEEIRNKQSMSNKKHWKHLSLDERNNRYLKISLGKEKYASIDNATNTEMLIKNYLNLYKIDYKFQWTNKTYNPEFYQKFKYNEITLQDISPYHLWDFKLNLKDKEILLDIDGSIHNDKIIINKHTRENKLINITDLSNFNDSKRIYLTDGLDAYVIQCHDDKINLDNIVKNIKTNEIMTFKQFLSLLEYMNSNNKDKKELLKYL